MADYKRDILKPAEGHYFPCRPMTTLRCQRAFDIVFVDLVIVRLIWPQYMFLSCTPAEGITSPADGLILARNSLGEVVVR